MGELKVIQELLQDVWKFFVRYQGVELNDGVCDRMRKDQEQLVGRYGQDQVVQELNEKIMAAVLSYFVRRTEKGAK